jgi:hypothetical protein
VLLRALNKLPIGDHLYLQLVEELREDAEVFAKTLAFRAG